MPLQLRIWTYPEGNHIHTLSTGLHSKGIHSAKFIKEYPQRVVSGTQKVIIQLISNFDLLLQLLDFNCIYIFFGRFSCGI
jgi:hypothetical protein